MNNISILGRITKDVELTHTPNGVPLCRFNVAVPSELKTSDGEKQADFFICIAWRDIAEKIVKYFKKGYPIGIVGAMNSRVYQKEDGSNQTIWELNVKGFSFVSSNDSPEKSKEKGKSAEALTPLDDDESGDLPF